MWKFYMLLNELDDDNTCECHSLSMDSNLVIMELEGDKPSAATLLTNKLYMLPSNFLNVHKDFE